LISPSYAKRNYCASSKLRKYVIALRMEIVYYRVMNIESPLSGTTNRPSWDVALRMIRFVRAMHELERCDPKQAAGLSMQQLKALLYLIQSEGSTVKELAHGLSLSEARASRLADELTISGHVLGERNPSDRRQVRLRATAMGASKANLVFGQRIKALEAALDGVSDEDLDAFLRVLDRIVVEMEALAERSSAAVESVPAQ
jgi:DNA-binding MarR family transcriptional regulator